LTYSVPKPLLPVGGEPILGHTLGFLAEAGCEVAALNLHHQGYRIRDHFGDHFGEMPVVYSEEEHLLGTLGAVGPLRYVFETADLVVVINGDSLCRWPLEKIIKKHLKSEAAVTLLVSDKAAPEDFGGGVGLDEDDRIVSFRPDEAYGEVVKRRVFAGLHVFSPRLLEEVPPGPRDFVQHLYRPLLAAGQRLQALSTGRDWHDLGTPGRYLQGTLDWVRGRAARRLLQNRSLVAEDAQVHESASLQGSAVEAGARVEEGARIESSVVLPGAIVNRDCELRDVIVGYGVSLPAATVVHGRMINAQTADFTAGARDSLVGNLVYTPLEVGPPDEPRQG
jgi:mannose-1-phosphate guanylyltransferase